MALSTTSKSGGSYTTTVHMIGDGRVLALTFSAGSPEGQCGVNLILDLDEGIQHHWTTVVEVNTVLLHSWLVSRLIWILHV